MKKYQININKQKLKNDYMISIFNKIKGIENLKKYKNILNIDRKFKQKKKAKK